MMLDPHAMRRLARALAAQVEPALHAAETLEREDRDRVPLIVHATRCHAAAATLEKIAAYLSAVRGTDEGGDLAAAQPEGIAA